jgi:hypothetical protein
MATEDLTGRPYALISTDGHAGADLWDYKPYLEARWHDEFDAWAGSYSDAWGEVDPASEFKAGVSSYQSPISWDSELRLRLLREQGIVAEVLFPNTAALLSHRLAHGAGSAHARRVRAPVGRRARPQPLAA